MTVFVGVGLTGSFVNLLGWFWVLAAGRRRSEANEQEQMNKERALKNISVKWKRVEGYFLDCSQVRLYFVISLKICQNVFLISEKVLA